MRFALRIPSSLAAQLLLAASGGLVVVMLMAGVVLAALLMQGPADATRQGLEDTAKHLERGLRFDAQGRPVQLVLSDKHRAMVDGLPKDFSYRILDALGHVLMSGEDGPAA
jgi:hypothetical protein